MIAAMRQSRLSSLPLVGRGKVRDLYAVGDDRLLIVQSDRISAFDVVMNEPVPGKGAVLTRMSNFWFSFLSRPNHLTGEDAESAVVKEEREMVRGRAMLVRRLTPLPVEAVCRGYLVGSGWKEYQKTGEVCGLPLPAGLQLASRLPQVIFTPATKAREGEHDENISFDKMAEIIGDKTADKVYQATLQIYEQAARYARGRGVIIADTKFEFALDGDELVLIDEVLTPDSSRFWRAADWRAGAPPASFDKQILRDWLETTAWDKSPPPPPMPPFVIAATAAKYAEIEKLLIEKLLLDDEN